MLGCRDTALHVAAASKGAHARAAMVSFLIAERADVNKANKKGCATRAAGEAAAPTRVLRRVRESADRRLAGTRRCIVRR